MDNELKLIDEIEIMPYATSSFHKYLDLNNDIGQKYEELTIVILSYNRVECTLRLLDSINKYAKNFKGEILIIDNGSSNYTLKKINEKIIEHKINCRIIKNKKNIGASRARNKAIKNIKTKWAMVLDNDVYFIKDIFENIRESILQCGCKFLNIPLINEDEKSIFSCGGHIYISEIEGKKYVGCGTIYKPQEILDNLKKQKCMGTFLFGGAFVVEKEAFLRIGGFDKKIFLGFEDIDFSINIFKNGYKICSCDELGMVHKHTSSKVENDIDYEKKRFSREILYKSAEYFKEKHKLEVWSKVTDDWIEEQKIKLGIKEGVDNK